MISAFYENEKTIDKERDLSAREALNRLLPLLKPFKIGLFICLLLLAGATALSVSWPILLKMGIDNSIAAGDYRGLLVTVFFIALMQGANLILQYIQRVRLEIIGQDILIDLRETLFNHILSSSVSFFDKNPTGRLMARVESDTDSLRMLFTNTVIMLIGDMILVAGIFGVMFYYSWKLAAILFWIVPLVGTLVYIFHKMTSARFLSVRKKMAEITAALTEFLHGMSIIQIFHRQEYARQKFDTANRMKFKDESFVHIAGTLFSNVVFFLEYLMIGLVLYLGALWIESGDMTVGTISMFIILIWRSYEPIHRASEQITVIQKSLAGAKRIFALLSEKQIISDPLKPVAWKGLEQGIRFENVWFSYDGDQNYALKDATFEIRKGKQLALAGATGGGKTTVISLLYRLYDPQKGRITVDGIDIRDIAREDLRRKFSLVLQDIVLFPGDINYNIALDSDGITEEKILTASRTVDAHRFISRLPDGYRTEVSEKGANFSRGERQLLSFARALVNDPDLLILDEATSSVDPETERTIQESMKKLMAGRTSMVIAHRLSTILESDEILVIKRGEIIERGTHTELILNNGYYSRLFHLQYKNGVTAT